MEGKSLVNKKIASQLLLMAKKDRMPHAVLFVGGTASERLKTGNWLASYLLCGNSGEDSDSMCGECLSCRKFLHGNHEDFILIKKPEDRESIVKDQILSLVQKLSMKPWGGRYVVVIEDAQLMNAASQNKLLKTLEEPVSEVIMILLAENADSLLPTVLSRCSVFFLQDEETSPMENAEAHRFAELICEGAPYYKKKAVISGIVSDKERSRELALEFLDALEEELLAKSKQNISGQQLAAILNAVGHVQAGRKYIKQLHSTAYTLKQLCLRA